ncbi:ribonuclease P protein subunit p30 [Clupea harengus]|uniref:Ribonuclease P protein subunit p30 n=1 Tax=Clupea harengus TaxID=7950 RepID=A0A6P3W5H1_CLUHA|nr:ribonuclease P protein subunit p30 [Clupea harengus]XP_031417277.1 ribonuclease P protein subunit p30 [Clupea harengus]
MVCKMAMFMDLNVNFTKDKKTLQNIIETAAHLGYSTVAINYTLESQQKKPEIPKPTSISDLFTKLPVVQGRSRPIRVLSRLTVVATDPSHFRPNAEYKAFDLVAVFPKTEKLFHAACMTFEVDIICVTVTEKQPFHFKRAPVNGAIDRGVFFEIVYTPAIRDSTMRRYTIGNSLGLMETCKGKGVILSSGAEKPLELRGPYDIANLGLVFGLSEGDAKAAVSTNCRSVVLNGETRTTAFGIIRTMKKPPPAPTASEEDKSEERENSAAKRAKMEH